MLSSIKSSLFSSVTPAAFCIGTAMLIGGCSSSMQTRSAVTTSESRADMSPAAIYADLKAGNDRFVRGNTTTQNWLSQAKTTAAEGQFPKAIVLSCLDSRVIPEMVFDQGIGDIFVGRVAGNFENTDQLGSMEFGTAVAGSKVIVVLGHTACGAVKGTIDQAELGNLTEMLTNIEPAVQQVSVGSMGRTSKDAGYVNKVVEANVRQTVKDISDRSPVLAGRVASGDLMIVGGVYDLGTGRVTWIK
ncbi:MAG: carbonic anhydrase family protein [Phycisphaerales bacterium]